MKIYGYSLPGLDKRYERAYNQNTPWGYAKTSMFCGLFSQNAGMACKHIMGAAAFGGATNPQRRHVRREERLL